MKIPLNCWLKATRAWYRAVRKYGITATYDRIEQIGKQSDFWFKECQRLREEYISAVEARDNEAATRLWAQYDSAMKRFTQEVEELLAGLTE